MTKPKHFKLTSDYATTQNDARGTMSYTIPAGTVIAPGATGVFDAYSTLGTRNAYLRRRVSTSNTPGKWFIATTLISDANVSLDTIGPASWPLYHDIQRTAPTLIRAYCELHNNSPYPMTVTTTQTITWEVNTFLSPFPA
jgi:hypothetical protein